MGYAVVHGKSWFVQNKGAVPVVVIVTLFVVAAIVLASLLVLHLYDQSHKDENPDTDDGVLSQAEAYIAKIKPKDISAQSSKSWR
ncbi:hypothetical protein C2869_10945 [Saccharobesus litoralis]|uniref:Uncharacterized protein n=1 Tax=Saccharobesus litoralis TaxID=2172099 RepID=A0A2S0VS40_9ALTE|nr:hypothetical protein C2869_10945 [Saccharobesus litoralis]